MFISPQKGLAREFSGEEAAETFFALAASL